MGGILIGEPLIGGISDRFGRKIALIIGIIGVSVSGGLAALGHDFTLYAV